MPNDYIAVAASADFNFGTGDFTISTWVNIDAFGSFPYLFDFRDSSGTGNNVITCYIDSSRISIFAGGSVVINGSAVGTVLSTGIWYNIIIKRDSGTVTTHINGGSADASGTFTGDMSTTPKLNIGARYDGNNGLNGKFSNFQIFNTALSQTDITSIYSNGTPLTDMSSFSSLVSWWKLDNTTTGIQDSAGSNNGTNNGATKYAGFVNTLAGDSTGMSQTNLVQSDLQTVAPYSKYALNFDGTNDYIDCGTTVQQPTTNYSVSYWVKFADDYVGNVGIVGNFKSQSDVPQVGFALTLSSGFYFQFWADGTENANGGLVTGTSVANPSTWYNVVGTYDGSLVKIYVNNVLENSVSYSATPSVTDQNLVIGRWYGNYSDYYTYGSISNVSIWNTALTSSQVREIYNEGLPSNLNNHSAYSNLVSWWQLGSNSSWNGNRWIVADEKGTNNGYSQNMSPYMPESGLTNGVGTTANGTSTGMSEGSLIGDAPYSTANAISSGMPVTARGTNVP